MGLTMWLQVRVTLGEYVLKSDVEPLPGRTYGATQIKVHPYFRFTPQVTVQKKDNHVTYFQHLNSCNVCNMLLVSKQHCHQVIGVQ